MRLFTLSLTMYKCFSSLNNQTSKNYLYFCNNSLAFLNLSLQAYLFIVFMLVWRLEPEPDRIWNLNRSHITGSGLPDSVDPAQYPDINPDIRL